MALTLNTTTSCKYLSVLINYTTIADVNVTINIVNYSGVNIFGSNSPNFTITSTSAPINYPVSVSDLSVVNGLVTVILVLSDGTEIDRKSALLHCDIDCCLTKLTNELIDCACDCAKCATSLAKAQKIFLLLQSADYAIVQANDASAGTLPGFLQDANSKYLKAKEVCDESCGCNC